MRSIFIATRFRVTAIKTRITFARSTSYCCYCSWKPEIARLNRVSEASQWPPRPLFGLVCNRSARATSIVFRNDNGPFWRYKYGWLQQMPSLWTVCSNEPNLNRFFKVIFFATMAFFCDFQYVYR